MLRLLLRLIKLLLVVVLLVAALLGVVLFTETGLRQTVALVPKLLPVTLEVRELRGSLAGDLNLAGLQLNAGELDLQLERFRFAWRPGELLQGRLHIEQLLVEQTRLHLPPAAGPPPEEPPTEPFQLTDVQLPLALTLDELRLRDLRVFPAEAEEPLVLDEALLRARTDDTGRLRLETLEARAPQGRVALQGELTPLGDYPLALDLDWQLDMLPQGELRGSGELRGALGETLTLTHALEGFAHAELTAEVRRALSEPAWTLELDARLDDLGQFSPELAGSPLDAELSGSGTLDAFELRAALDSRIPQLGPLTARLDLSGTPRLLRLRELRLDARDSPLGLIANADIDLDRQTVDASGEWRQLAWPLTGPADYASPEGRFRVSGTLEDYRAELDARLTGAQLTELDARIEAHGDLQRVRIDSLSVSERGDNGLMLEASAELELEALAFDARGTWQGARWPLLGEPEYRSAAGSFEADGTLDEYRFLLQAEVDGISVPQGDWRLTGRGSASALEQLDILGLTLDGELSGTVAAAWQPSIDWRAELRGSTLNPGVLWPDLPGSVNFELRSTGELVDGLPRAELELSELGGTLAQRALGGRILLNIDRDDLVIDTLNLSAGDAALQVSGSLADRWDIDWQLDVPALQGLLPDARGRVRGNGRVQGPRNQPEAALALDLADLALAGNRIGQLTGNADIDLGGTRNSRLELRGQRLVLGGQNWSALRVDADGTPTDHRLQVGLDGEPGRFELALAGGLDEANRWQGQLTRLRAGDTLAGDWQLTGPANLRAAADGAGLETACLRSQPSQLCLQGAWSATEGADVQLDLSEFTFDRFAELLPENLTLDTALSGRLQGRLGADGRPAGELQLALAPGAIRMLSQGTPVELTLGRSILDGSLDNDNARGELNLDLGELGSVNADATLTELFTRQLVDGRLLAELDDFTIVSQLAPQLQDIAGQLNADLRLSGPLRSADVQGRVRLSDGAVSLPDTGITIEAIELIVDGPEPGILRFVGGARSGEGELRLNGRYQLGDQQLNLDVTGENFEALNTFSQLLISPDLDLIVTADSVRLEGEVTVPMANLSPPPNLSSRVAPSGDVVIVRQDADSAPPPPVNRQVYARLRVNLGDEVWVEAAGFRGQLRGNLLIEQAPQLDPRGSGSVEVVAGDYTIYGQELAIERGRLLFSGGPIDNPGLDLRVARNFDNGEVQVGARVTGSLREPRLDFFSTPAMANSSVVSYLIFGRGPGGDAGENALLLQAASALGARGGNYLTADIAERLGLDISFEGGTNPDDSELQIGRYLAPNLYVSYGIGLFDAVNTFNLRYELTRNILVESTSSSESNSVDLLYSIER